METKTFVNEEQTLATIGPDESTQTLTLIQRAVKDPEVSVDKMERLFALQEKWEDRQAAKLAHAAMIAVRSEMPEIVKDTRGENAKYAKLEKIDRIAYPIYTRHGFSLQWSEGWQAGVIPHPGWTSLKCVVLHNGGHREEHFLVGPMDDKGPKGAPNKTGIQGMGSTWSYLQRRLLAMIFNLRIVGEDNDGAGRPSAPAWAQTGHPSDPLKTAKARLWEALKQLGFSKIEDAEIWMTQQKVISAPLGLLNLEALNQAAEKVEITLQERK